MNENQRLDELFDCYTKQAITRAETMLKSFLKALLIRRIKRKLVHLLSNFRIDVLKNLFI